MNKRSSGRSAGFLVVGVWGLWGLLGLGACASLSAQSEPTLAEKADRIEVYFPGQSPRCDSFEDLGMIQAVLETEPAGKTDKADKANLNVEQLNTVLDQLRAEAAKRGATGVFLVERKHQSTGLIAIGNAVRCKGDQQGPGSL